ncbi:MAG: two-component regulator propeller domain-containing protein, partial [Anaerolineae bacterium]|nr:two-component regulator propeller domain-containing protein [Anaerolineae bacterium]
MAISKRLTQRRREAETQRKKKKLCGFVPVCVKAISSILPHLLCLAALVGTLSWPVAATAQEGGGYWRHYTTANSGLLADAIQALAYTEDAAIDLAIPGLWIGTDQGLNYTNSRDWVGYTTANSPLPNDTIHALYKDAADRDLWIATDDGLAHFDYGGTPRDPTDDHWEIFTTAEGLPANRVLSLAAGEGAELWAGTAQGLARYNGTTWAPYTETAQVGEVRDLRYDAARNRVWAATEQGVGWVAIDANAWIPLGEDVLDARLSGSDARALALDQEGRIWVGTAGGLALLDPDRQEGSQIGNDAIEEVWVPGMTGLPDTPITDLAFDPTGRYLWVATDGGGASRYDTAAQRWSRLTTPGSALPDAHVRVVLPSHEGLTWLGTASGLSGVEQLWETTHFTALPDPQSLPAYALIASWMAPESGTLWVASEGGGVSRSNDGGFTWETFTTAEGLGSDSILALWGDDSGIWAGTDGSGVSHTTDGGATWQTFTTEQGLGDDVITALWGDGAGTLWVGTYGGGISLTADGGATWQTLTPDPALGLDSVFNIRGDSEGRVWVDTGYGNLAVTSDGGQSWEAVTASIFSTDALDNLLLPRPALWSDTQGYMWVGTYGQGLARTGDRGKHWDAFTTAEGLGSDAITTLWGDDRGTLWVGTDGGGVSRTTDGGATWQTFTSEQGLAAGTVSAIWGDPEGGTIWVATWTSGAGIAGSPNRLAISRSDDGGASWKLFDVSPENVLGSDEITAIWSSDTAGALWVGLYDRGVARSTDNGTSWQTFTPKQGVGSPYVTSIWEDASALWVGTKGGGISRTVNRGQSWETFTTAAGLASNDVLAVWGDRLGVWVGTDGGGVSFSDDDGANWRTFTTAQGLGDNTIRAIHGDRTGIWAGTQSGLSFSEDDGATWQTFTTTHGLGSDAISALWVDRRGNIWVGTQGGGISRTTDGGASWQTFSLIERTGSNTVVALWGDDAGSIWVCTNSGISRTTDDGRTWQTFTHDESWGRVARLNTLWGDAAGGIWAGTTQGLSHLRTAPGLPTLPQWTAPERLNTRATFRLLDAQVLEAQFAGLRFAPASESRAVQYTAVLSPTIPGANVLTQTFAVGEIGPLGIAPVTFGEGASPLAFGDYSLQLTAHDAFGSQVTTTRTVEVQARPILTQAPAQQEGPGYTAVLVPSLPGGTAPFTLTLAVEDPDSPNDTFALEYAWDPTPDSLWQP